MATKPLRLFVLSHKNIERLLDSKLLSPTAKVMLQLALGTRTTRARQFKAYKVVLRGPNRLPGRGNTRAGQRLSVAELDHQVFEKLSREFLIPQRYDGYYSPPKPSIFHGGVFHSEIMLSRPTQTIAPVVKAAARPAASQSQVIKNLSGLFVEYSKTQKRLLRPYGGFVVYLGGGMAVKLYLQARALKAPTLVNNTKDFDFTFAVPRQLRSKIQVDARVVAMRRIMRAHVEGFTTWLARSYGVHPQVEIKEFVPPVTYLPVLRKHVYHVVSYGLKFPGQKKAIDLIDTTLACIPSISREVLHPTFSRFFGLPIERLKYLHKNVLAVLAGSFATKDPALKSRNPLVGNRAEKGLKNTARIAALIRANSRKSTPERRLVANIRKGRTANAFKQAKLVLAKL